MKKTGSILFLLVYFATTYLFAQEIKVIDKQTYQPIRDVVIYNLDKTAIAQTNNAGVAVLKGFKESDYLSFQHPSYHEKALSYAAIKNSNFLVELEEDVIQIQEVVVSANRWEQKSDEIPNNITAISAKEVTFANPQTSADLLTSTGQVFVQKSQQGGGSPMLRGFAANSVLLVLDGVRMNNAIYRSGNLQNVINVDPNVLEGAEVIMGPGSVIYGSDALGGVMDFHTKQPLLSSSGQLRFEGSAMLRYGTANKENTGHLDFTLGGKKFGSLSSISYSDFGDLRAGNNYPDEFPDFGKRFEYVVRENGEDKVVQNDNVNIQRFSGFSQFNLMQKFIFKPSNKLDFNYNLYYSTTSDIPRYDRLTQRQNEADNTGPLVYAEWYYGPQEWLLNSLQTNFNNTNFLYNHARITLAHQQYVESRNDRKINRNSLRERTDKVDVLSFNFDLNKDLKENQLFYGLEYIYNYVTSEGVQKNILDNSSQPTSTRYPDEGSFTHSLAAYGSYRHKLNQAWILNTGLRFTHYILQSSFSRQFYDFPFNEIDLKNSAINGNIGLVFNQNNWKVSGLFSTGFRAPNVDDVAKIFDSEPGNVVVPNPNLKSEYNYNIELGVSKKWNKLLYVEATTFGSVLDNAMVRRDFLFNGQDSIIYDGKLSKVQSLVNTNKAIIYGVTGSIKLQLLDYLYLFSHLTYTDGKDITDDLPLRHTPPLFGQTSLIFQKTKWRAELQTQYQAKREFEDLAPDEQSKTNLYTPAGSLGWTVLNLKGSYKVSKHLHLFTGLENILDKHYRPYSSGISAPGRNLYVSVRGYF